MLGLLFPGQGSQHVGMGTTLREHPVAAELFQRADEALSFPLSRLMAEGPEDELTATRNAQPALLTHSVAVHAILLDRLGAVAYGAGHSLGEFSAHVAAGTLTFEDALVAVRLRGELMFAAGLERPGTMAAVLGLSDAEVEAVCGRVEHGVCVPANFNTDGQVVISGDVRGVEEAMALLKDAGAKRVLPLKVSGAFHSPLMEPAVAGLSEHLDRVTFRDPAFPVISNVTASPVREGSVARRLLVEQLTAPVRWSASVRTMVELGVTRFLELGPGSVLHGLNKRNAGGADSSAIGELTHIESFGA